MKADDSGHTADTWNLMRGGASDRKRDLTDSQVQKVIDEDVTTP